MFKRKKTPKRAVSIISLFDANGSMLLEQEASCYELPEKIVLALSMEYFSDPEPCAIHRGAVQKRAMMELMEHTPKGAKVSLSLLPAHIRAYLPLDAAFIQITEAVT